MSHNIKPGVATGDQVQEIFNYAKQKGFALPAVNVVGSSTINGVLETAAKLNAPVIIQFSNGGAQFNAGKGLSNENQKSAILGGIAMVFEFGYNDPAVQSAVIQAVGGIFRLSGFEREHHPPIADREFCSFLRHRYLLKDSTSRSRGS